MSTQLDLNQSINGCRYWLLVVSSPTPHRCPVVVICLLTISLLFSPLDRRTALSSGVTMAAIAKASSSTSF